MISETDFVSAADATLGSIGSALDRAIEESDIEIDWTLRDGVLEIECPDASKLIVNRHLPNREIWVAAKSGGFHFAASGGAWRDRRTGEELGAALSRLMRSQAAIGI